MAEIYVRLQALIRSNHELGESPLFDKLETLGIGELALYRESEHDLLLGVIRESNSLGHAIAEVQGTLIEAIEGSGYELLGSLTMHAETLTAQEERAAARWPRYAFEADVQGEAAAGVDRSALREQLAGEFIELEDIVQATRDFDEATLLRVTGELCAADAIEAELDTQRSLADALDELGIQPEGMAVRVDEVGWGESETSSITMIRA